MPLPTLAVQVSPTGISAPTYAEIYQSLQDSFKIIYGSDAYVAPDSQDGQLLAIFAKAINDANQQAINVYNSFSPNFAQGAGLSSIVKINGLKRLTSSFSTATGNVVGVAGTVIVNGVVKDANDNLWNLPASVTIPGGGSISVTVTSQTPGAIVAPSGSINVINTPTLGWQSFVSTADASPGAPVETDAALRRRQAQSTSLTAQTPVQAMYAAIANLPGVTRLVVYENDTNTTDANGLPPHSVSVVVLGGVAADIAEVIGQKKTPGAATYGSTSQSYTDPVSGIAYTINFYILALSTINIVITGTALAGYSTNVAAEIKQAVSAYINSLSIGQPVQWTRLFGPAYLNGAPDQQTYEITALTSALGAGAPGTIDIPIDFNKAAFCDAAVNVTVTIT